jgi:sulfofructose kinase
MSARRSRTREATRFDVVGLGFNTDDHVCLVSSPPALDGKQRLQRYGRFPGGQVPTALVALQRWGLRTAYVGPFGDDEAGARQRAALTAAGVDTGSAPTRAGIASQTSFIVVDAVTGERTVLWTRPDGLALRADELDPSIFSSTRAVLLDADDGDTALRAAGWARTARALVMLDVDEPTPETTALLALTGAAIVSESFARRFTGEADLPQALRRMAARGPRLTAATLGSGGAVACVGRRLHYAPAFRVRVVDSTSAGDLFHAGCLYGLLHRWPIDRTLRFASAAAALACTRFGGRPSIPDFSDVRALAAQPRAADRR